MLQTDAVFMLHIGPRRDALRHHGNSDWDRRWCV